MSDLKINNITPLSGNIKVGNTNVSQIYCGSTLVWPLAGDDVVIGTQTWTRYNLNVDTYADGYPIPQVTDPTEWVNLTTGAWCYYNNNSANDAIYGKLYNWYAVAGIWNEASKTDLSQRKQFAPTGYHVPTDNEWITLTNYVNSIVPTGNIGGKMRSTSTLWLTNVGATNSSGFTGLPGGLRDPDDGAFRNDRIFGYWWSSTAVGTANAYIRFLTSSSGDVLRSFFNNEYGFSVRLIENN
jgi:uncharacterized protein (TIGR02145 family)